MCAHLWYRWHLYHAENGPGLVSTQLLERAITVSPSRRNFSDLKLLLLTI